VELRGFEPLTFCMPCRPILPDGVAVDCVRAGQRILASEYVALGRMESRPVVTWLVTGFSDLRSKEVSAALAGYIGRPSSGLPDAGRSVTRPRRASLTRKFLRLVWHVTITYLVASGVSAAVGLDQMPRSSIATSTFSVAIGAPVRERAAFGVRAGGASLPVHVCVDSAYLIAVDCS
jgi:hypothetical protein